VDAAPELPAWLPDGISIARTELRRSVRSFRRDRLRIAVVAVAVVVSALWLGLATYVLRAVVADGRLAVGARVRGVVAAAWAFVAYLAFVRSVSGGCRVDHEPLLLTTTSPRAVLLGLVLSELGRTLLHGTVPAAALLAGWLAGGPAGAAGPTVAVVAFVASAVVAGFATGTAGALLTARNATLARYRRLVVVAAVAVAAVLYSLGGGAIPVRALGRLPVGWFADVFVAGSPVGASPERALAAVALALVGVPALFPALGRLAERLWFGDDEAADTVRLRSVPSGRSVAVGRPLRRRLPGRPVRATARATVIRTLRRPRRLALLVPVAVAAGVVGRGDALAALAAVVLGAWAAGVLFGSNPIGDHGPVAPVALLSAPATRIVRGVALPGLALGVPVAVAATLAVALAGTSPASAVALLVAEAALASAAAVGVALGVGAGFPRFDADRADRGPPPPGVAALAAYTIAVAIPAGVAVEALVAWPALAPLVRIGLSVASSVPGLDPGAVVTATPGSATRWLVVAAATGTQIASGVVGYRYAVRRFETLDPAAL